MGRTNGLAMDVGKCSNSRHILKYYFGNMDGPRDEHIKWSKPERERQKYDAAYMWNLQNKMMQMNLHTKQK